jgi:drug/metabolite transporter (DMT)-like permease
MCICICPYDLLALRDRSSYRFAMTTAVLPVPAADRPMLGIAFMLGFCLLAPMGDALAKYLGAALPVMLLVVVRFAAQFVLLAPLVVRRMGHLRLSARIWWLTLLRACLHICGIWWMFTSLQYLPLADAIAIAFVMPFILLLLGHFLLEEEVGPHRMVACAFGFTGTLMVIQPSFAAVGWPALLPVGVAVVFALFMLVTRSIAKTIDPVTLQAINGAQATIIVLTVLTFSIGFEGWRLPVGAEIGLLFAVGAVGTLAHLAMTWSLRYAPSTTLAPMQYLEIPVATVIGLVVFGAFPNGFAALGIAVTVATGLYIIWRENRAHTG